MIFVNREKFLAVFVLIIFLMSANDFGKTGENLLNLMPMPEKAEMREEKFLVTKTFINAIEAVSGAKTRRAARAVRRMLNQLEGRTGLFFSNNEITIKRHLQIL